MKNPSRPSSPRALTDEQVAEFVAVMLATFTREAGMDIESMAHHGEYVLRKIRKSRRAPSRRSKKGR